MELRGIILQHNCIYPRWQVMDLVKLIYQNEFGPGHYISDSEASLERLRAEIKGLPQNEEGPLFVDLGNGFGRLHLDAARGKLSVETINRLFILSAKKRIGSMQAFGSKLEAAKALCAEGLLPFAAGELERFLIDYKARGYPAVGHSEEYRQVYSPGYRVINSTFAHYFDLLQKIEQLLEKKKYVVAAIDGPAASGKTTLAKLLKDIYACPVISMDHFFLRPEQRTKERLQEAGGNVDYERFQKEVLPGLGKGESFGYRVYNCQTQSFTAERSIPKGPLRVVEGSYSLHPRLSGDYDLRVFLTIEGEEQKRRILARNGPEMFKRFVNEWIPLEEKYFAVHDIAAQSDLVLNSKRS